jgi:hypothetical protein
MIVDFSRRQVIPPNWHAEFVDCSTSEVQCLEVPNRFMMSFPISCASAEGGWSAAGTRFTSTAPEVHYGLPSGGYVSGKYPHIHLLYRKGIGFRGWSRTIKRPNDAGWNEGEDRAEEYPIVYRGSTSPFHCR